MHSQNQVQNQNSSLLLDIQSYRPTKEIISNIYYIRNKHLLEYEENADLNWLVSDLILFMKKFNLSKYKYCLSIEKKSYKNNMSVEKKLNKYWSSLTPNQRDIFIQIRKIK
jgi:hypothetical protein